MTRAGTSHQYMAAGQHRPTAPKKALAQSQMPAPGMHRVAVLVLAWTSLLFVLYGQSLVMAAGLVLCAAAITGLGFMTRPSAWLRVLLTLLPVVFLLLASASNSVGTTQLWEGVVFMILAGLFQFSRTIAHLQRLLAVFPGAAASLFLHQVTPLTITLASTTFVSYMFAAAILAGAADGETDARLWPRVLMSIAVLGACGAPGALLASFALRHAHVPMLFRQRMSLAAQVGFNDHMAPDEISQLKAGTGTAFRVRFDKDPGDTNELYWRGSVLWTYDGSQWLRPAWLNQTRLNQTRLNQTRQAVTGTPGARADDAVLPYRLWMQALPGFPAFILDRLVGSVTGSLVSADGVGRTPVVPLGERVEIGALADPAAGRRGDGSALDAREREAALRLPKGIDPRTRALVSSWRAAGATDAQMIHKTLQFFDSSLTYSLAPPLYGDDAVDALLFEGHKGFCAHFSSAFAVMMRMAGIPTRVVVGYVGASKNAYGGYWRVRQAMAHAWDEVWLDGRGWVRVDPTRAVMRVDRASLVRPAGWMADFDDFLSGDGADWVRTQWDEGGSILNTGSAWRSQAMRALPWLGLVILALCVGVVVRVWLTWRTGAARRRVTKVEAAARILERRMARLGLGRRPGEGWKTWSARTADALDTDCRSSFRAACLAWREWCYARVATQASATQAALAVKPRLARAPRRD